MIVTHSNTVLFVAYSILQEEILQKRHQHHSTQLCDSFDIRSHYILPTHNSVFWDSNNSEFTTISKEPFLIQPLNFLNFFKNLFLKFYFILFFPVVKTNKLKCLFYFQPQVCGAITLLTHYCWLSVFSWNFCQALHIILTLFGNRFPKRHYIPLILIGWGELRRQRGQKSFEKLDIPQYFLKN